MEKEYLSTIWPVLYFEAEWPPNIPNFDLGVQLIKADKTVLEEITEWGGGNNCWGSNINGADNMRDNTDWFLAMNRPEITEHISVNEIGMSFVDSLQRAIVDSFLMCLQLVRSTAAICPFKFPAEICEDSISSDDVDTSSDFYGINSDKPDVYLPEAFEIGDLQIITDLWSALIKIRKLDKWSEYISKEEFFADIDKKAGEDVIEKRIKFITSLPFYSELSEENRKQIIDSIKKPRNKGSESEFWKKDYRESFPKVFQEKQEEVFSDRMRIGRALNIFFKGVHLPLQDSFLSMCLVLETLFTVDKGETMHKLTTRLAKIIGSRGVNGKKERKEMHKRAMKVYEERSNIVHGTKLIDAENTEVLKDAFLFARRGLQRILLDPKLLGLYSDPGTTDKKVKEMPKKDAKNAIREYFLDLDLQCD